MTAPEELDPDHPHPGEPFEVAGERARVLPLVTQVIMAVEDRARALYLVEANDRRRWTLEPRDTHDGVRFKGRPLRDD